VRYAPVFTNFISGEFSPKLYGRVDLPSFFNSCRTLQNYLIMKQGGVIRRPGLKYITSTKTDQKASLIPFKKDASNVYMLEFTNLLIRVYKNGAIVGAPYEIVTTYTEAELFDLQFDQAENEMWLVHPSHKPAKLTCTSDAVWVLDPDPTFTGSFVFNAAGDYPSCVCFFQARLCFAASNTHPTHFWASRTPTALGVTQYQDFTTGTAAADAMNYIIPGGDRVRWLAGKDYILIGTEASEFILTGGDGPLTPTTVYLKKQGSIGSANIQPVQIGSAVMFVQKNGKTMRELRWEDAMQSYAANDVTIMSDHIAQSGMIQLAVQRDPFNLVWAVTEEGRAVAMTYEREQDMLGWANAIVTDGIVESIGIIPSATEDVIYLSVKRTIGGATKRFVEYCKPIYGAWLDDQKDAFFVDSGVTDDRGAPTTISGATKTNPVVVTDTGHPYIAGDFVKIVGVVGMTELNNRVFKVAAPGANDFQLQDVDGNNVDGTGYTTYVSDGTAEEVTKTVSGLTHLQGEVVQICADGGSHPDRTVAAGAITLDDYYNTVHVGLGYISILLPMKMESGAQFGSSQSYIKKIDHVTLRVWETLGAKVGPTLDDLIELNFRKGDAVMDAPPPLMTDDIDITFPGGYSKGADIYVVQDLPLPQAILAVIIRLMTYEAPS